MKRIVIKGNRPLSGTIKIGGAKNSVVGLFPAALLSNGKITIDNVPNISDKNALILIMRLLGAKINYRGSKYEIDTTEIVNKTIPVKYSSKLRASYYFMGVLLAKFGRAEVYLPGGCNIGERPIDLHLEGFKKLGATVTQEGDKYVIEAKKLKGAKINLKFASVGATINILFAAVKAKGKTVITNAAKEPEIVNIAEFLNNMGAKITGVGTDRIVIKGVKSFKDAKISVLPDRIEAGTYLIMGALMGENFTIDGVEKEDMEAVFDKFDEMNIKYEINGRKVKMNKATDFKGIDVASEVFPGFPTDLGQPLHVLMSCANSKSTFEENIFETRMEHIKYLKKMGANMTVVGNKVSIEGNTTYKGAKIIATDLRGGAAMVLAGLLAKGTTVIDSADYILRGYENIIKKLSKVGAKIEIEEI